MGPFPDSSWWFQVTQDSSFTLAIVLQELWKCDVFAWGDTLTFLNITGEQQAENT